MMRFNYLCLGFFLLASISLSSIAALADTSDAAKSETISVFGESKIQVPAEFKRVEPKSRIIEHEFQATAGDGEKAENARVTMMAAGGDVKANIDRWMGQFTGGNKDAQKSEQMKVGQWEVHIVDVNGNYAERMGGGPFAGGKTVVRKEYAMTGAILVNPEGRKFFVKMIGPGSVINANRDRFVKMIKSVQ